MSIGLLATKEGMTQLFIQDGVFVPVTVLKVLSNVIVRKKTLNSDGYNALQIAYGSITKKKLNKPELGFFKKAGASLARYLIEFRVDDKKILEYNIGNKVELSIFKKLLSLDVSSISKGKGFQGVMKRYNFKGFRATHGTHESFRGGGSIGQCTKPGKVFKGKKMPGRMGFERVTVKNLRIIKIIEEDNLICLRGAVPGANGGLVELKASNRLPKSIQGISIESKIALKKSMSPQM